MGFKNSTKNMESWQVLSRERIWRTWLHTEAARGKKHEGKMNGSFCAHVFQSPLCHPLAESRWKNPTPMEPIIDSLQESTSQKQRGKGEKRTNSPKSSLTTIWECQRLHTFSIHLEAKKH